MQKKRQNSNIRLVALPLKSRIEPHHINECVASSRLLPKFQVMVSGICCIRDRGEDRRTRKSRLPPFSRGHLVHCCSAVVVVVTGTGVGRLTSIDTRHVQRGGRVGSVQPGVQPAQCRHTVKHYLARCNVRECQKLTNCMRNTDRVVLMKY